MGSGPTHRVFGAAKRLLKTLLSSGEIRLRLAVIELEEERARLVSLLLLAGSSLVLLLLGIGTIVAFIVVLFWDSYRLAAIAISAILLLLASGALGAIALKQARTHTLLKETLNQLATDRALLEANDRERHEIR
ncbi:phage holin family protein [Halomonas sp. Bachu 37]|uniref:phage holin family protein n=1 Tax=Halomonas kashgarensis TaxID=3084920 RepID=UPI003216B9F3